MPTDQSTPGQAAGLAQSSQTSPFPNHAGLPLTIELSRVRKSYGEFVAVDDISFTIPQGTVFGLLGPNGAGKTSTIRMMIGITAPDSGVINVFGKPFERKSLEKIGYLPEERGLYKKMKILDQLIFLGELHGMSAVDARRKSIAWCERLEIAE